MALQELNECISPGTLKIHGPDPGEPYWSDVLRLAADELDDDLHHHLQSLLTADAVAGDADLAWAETADDLVAPPPESELVHGRNAYHCFRRARYRQDLSHRV